MRTNPAVNLLVVSCLVVLAGCMTPSKDVLTSADYGPFPTDYQRILTDQISSTLKDPWSAHFEFDAPRKGWCGGDLLMGMKKRYGWIVTVRVNAKNGFGAYAGWESHTYLFTGGQVIDMRNATWGGLSQSAGYAE